MVSNVINDSPWLFIIIWNFGPENQTGSHILTWYSHTTPWFWRGEFSIVHAIKLQINFQGDVLLAVLDLLRFLTLWLTQLVIFTGVIFSFQNVSRVEQPWWISSGVTTDINFIFIFTTLPVYLNCELLIWFSLNTYFSWHCYTCSKNILITVFNAPSVILNYLNISN